VAEQAAIIEQMHERIQELEARLAKDSHNSSRPPFSDSPFKKPPPRSRRQPSGRKPGGQPGRRGVTRSLVDDPDQCVIIPLPGICAGRRGGTGIATTGLAERRQVVEVVIQREVIEYRIVSRTYACVACARRHNFVVLCDVIPAFSMAEEKIQSAVRYPSDLTDEEEEILEPIINELKSYTIRRP